MHPRELRLVQEGMPKAQGAEEEGGQEMSEIEERKKCSECGSIRYSTTSHKCDGCGKLAAHFPIQVEHHTSCWGNDSHESYETFDFCSVDCLSLIQDVNIGDSSWSFEITMKGGDMATLLEGLGK